MTPSFFRLLFQAIERAFHPLVEIEAEEEWVVVYDSYGAPLSIPKSALPALVASELKPTKLDRPGGPWWVLNPEGMRAAFSIAIEEGDADIALLTLLANTTWVATPPEVTREFDPDEGDDLGIDPEG